MARTKEASQQPGSRQSAYTARNRKALIASAQEVLAEIGPGATIEQISRQAQVSPTTIYNYFENKDALLGAALDEMWRDWVRSAYENHDRDETFQSMLDVCRELFRVDHSDPLFAKVLRNTLRDPSFVISAVKDGGIAALRVVADSGGLQTDDFDKRMNIWAYSLAGILHGVHVTRELAPADADESLGISLAIWGIPPDVAHKMTSRKMENFRA